MEETQTTEQDKAPAILKIDAVNAFNTTEAYLTELSDDYLKLKIVGPDDKDGFKAAKEGKQKCVKLRTGVDKRRLQLNKEVNAVAKSIGAKLLPIETNLDKEIKIIEDAKEKKEKEEKEKEAQQFKDRTDKLFECGCTYNGAVYMLGEVFVTPGEVQMSEQAAFDEILNRFKTTQKAIADKKAADEFAADELTKQKADLEAREKLLAEKMAKLGLDVNGDPLSSVKEPAKITGSEVVGGFTAGTTSEAEKIRENKAAEVAKNMGALRKMELKFGGVFGAPKSFANEKKEFKVCEPAVNVPFDVQIEAMEIESFSNGFKSCQLKVVMLLADPAAKFTKAQLIEKVNTLTVS